MKKIRSKRETFAPENGCGLKIVFCNLSVLFGRHSVSIFEKVIEMAQRAESETICDFKCR